MCSPIGTAKLNGLDSEARLRDIIGRIADHTINRIAEFPPRTGSPPRRLPMRPERPDTERLLRTSVRFRATDIRAPRAPAGVSVLRFIEFTLKTPAYDSYWKHIHDG
jgi:hypothetical protein